MKSLESFIDEQSQQLERFIAMMSRREMLETTPVCVDLTLSMMCRTRNH
jgi:hypothetical protein